MTLIQKIICSSPNLLGFIYMLDDFTIGLIHKKIPSMEAYYVILLALLVLTLIQLIFLISRLWKYKNIEKSIKSRWTILILFYNLLITPYYIWVTDDKLQAENQQG